MCELMNVGTLVKSVDKADDVLSALTMFIVIELPQRGLHHVLNG